MIFQPNRRSTRILALIFLLVTIVRPAYAGMINAQDLLVSTDSTISLTSSETGELRQRIAALLTQHGVPEEAAQRRAESLTVAELSLLQSRFHELPAGQGALSVLGALFLVLLVLELLGVTNVFNRI